jgi:hypothetical protein
MASTVIDPNIPNIKWPVPSEKDAKPIGWVATSCNPLESSSVKQSNVQSCKRNGTPRNGTVKCQSLDPRGLKIYTLTLMKSS